MDLDLAQKAINAALEGDWKTALALNKEILLENPSDIDALNRLARACAELGKIKTARSCAQKVLKVDPFNSIANKALKKWEGLREGTKTSSGTTLSESFIEEPGKTKVVPLLHLGDPKILAKLDAADEVKLTPHSHRVSVATFEGKYVGRLPDDLSARLIRFSREGYEYQTLIKSISPSEVKVFIRETLRPEKLSDIPTFLTEKIDYVAFTPPELVHKRAETSTPIVDEE